MPPRPPVEVNELKDAILRMMVREFDGRLLTWEVATQALKLAAFEVRQSAVLNGTA